MKSLPILTLALLIALLFSVDAWSAADDLEARARGIEGKLMSPCCMANTLSEHHSGIALKMRSEIRSMLREGRSEQEILDHYVAEYGELVLAAPVPRGFNLTVYILPFLLLIFGSAGVFVMALRWSRLRSAQEPRGTEPPAIDPRDAERLARRVRELG
jgi:cytochrome c-type biogenesis protein CcmH